MVQQPTQARGQALRSNSLESTTAGPASAIDPHQTMRIPCHYRDATDALSQLGWKAGANGDWVHANRRWLEYTGCSRAESLNGGWVRAVHADDRDRVLDGWAWAVAMEQRFECTCRLVRRDGTWRRFLLRTLPVVDASGQFAGWIGTATDVHALPIQKIGWVG